MSAGQWFRLYQGVVNDPKVQRLPVRLFKTWVNLLCLASENDDRGTLPPTKDLAFGLRMSAEKVELDLETLIEARLIDRDGDTLRMHDWGDWQYESDSSTGRVREHRARKTETSMKRFSNVSVTPPEQSRTEQITETDPEQIRTERPLGFIFGLYEKSFGSVNEATADRLHELEAKYPEVCVAHSFEEAARSNGRTLKYVITIMERHAREGCRSKAPEKPDQVKASASNTSDDEQIDFMQNRMERPKNFSDANNDASVRP